MYKLAKWYNFIRKFKILKLIVPKRVKKELNMRFDNPYSKLELENKFIFIHIPKTAGNGIIKSLYGKKATGHTYAIWYKKFDSKKFDKFFKFALVRNPWDRLVSAFFYLQEGGMNKKDKNFSDKYLKKHNNFKNFVLSLEDEKYRQLILSWVHFIPQYKFVFHKDNLLVDYIGKYENLEQSYNFIRKKLGINKNKKLEKHNASEHKPYYEYYNDKMIDIIYSMYEEDIKRFNYTFLS